MQITVALSMGSAGAPGVRESFEADTFAVDDKGALHVGATGTTGTDTAVFSPGSWAYVFKAPVTSDAQSA